MTAAPPASPVSYPLLDRHDSASAVANRHGRAIGIAEFLDDVARTVDAMAAMRESPHVLNTCSDRYRFAVGFAAILVSGRTSLLPSTLTQETIAQLRVFAPDAFQLTDGAAGEFDLPCVVFPDDSGPRSAPARAIPEIAADALAACVFTSGSTGLPVPHPKRWGRLVECVRAEGTILGLADGRRAAILGTVPPQHMYGFESTVLVALQSGATLSAARPLFPADICAELAALPVPRVLVTTPFHLRTLLESGIEIPRLARIVSATAPLSPGLAREAEARTGAPLVEIYGSTETGQVASRRTTEGAAWRLFPGVRLEQKDGRNHASGGHVEGKVPIDDVLELLDDGRFLLHGRSADMVNIAGKRSSIGYLNHQLCAIPGVVDGAFALPDGDAPDGVTRLSAAVVAPGLDRNALMRALRERIDAAFLPRRIAFVERLPRNATGKLPAAAMQALFAKSAPHTVTIGSDHPAFAGHFPGTPMLPGVVLLDEALSAVRAAGALHGDAWRIGAAKFFHPVQPGTSLSISHRTLATGAVEFEIADGATRVASGTFQPLVDAAHREHER